MIYLLAFLMNITTGLLILSNPVVALGGRAVSMNHFSVWE